MTRKIVWDTETTGSDADVDYIIEIGMVEIRDLIPTGRILHRYFRPPKHVDPDAVAVHGIDDVFLHNKPFIAEGIDEILAFIDEEPGTPLVAHNAEFDMGMLNAELHRLGRPAIPHDRAVDTLAMARSMFPGSPASLDALCRRFRIDGSRRTMHGALLDAQLLAECYIELSGGRQRSLGFGPAVPEGARPRRNETARSVPPEGAENANANRPTTPGGRTPNVVRAGADEIAAHRAFIDKKIKNPIWDQLENIDEVAKSTTPP